MNSPDAAISPAGPRGAEAGAEAMSSCPGDRSTPRACSQRSTGTSGAGQRGPEVVPGWQQPPEPPQDPSRKRDHPGAPRCLGKGWGHRLCTTARLPSCPHPEHTSRAGGHALQLSHCRKVRCKRRLSPSVNTSGPCSESEPAVLPPPRRCQAPARCR